MVGVPVLAWCRSGRSSRTAWLGWMDFRYLIKRGPTRKLMSSPVRMAKAVLSVMY